MSNHKVHLFNGLRLIAQLPEEQWHEVATALEGLKVGVTVEGMVALLPTAISGEDRIGLTLQLIELSDRIELQDYHTFFKTYWQELDADQTAPTDQEVDLATRRISALKPMLKPLRQTLRALELKEEFGWVYRDSRVITDIRLVFNDHLQDTQRAALLLHQLRLTVQQGKKSRDLYISFDRTDLQMLKDQIDRALFKEDTIREDYQDKLNIIDWNED